MSLYHLLYSRQGKAHDLILQENGTNAQNAITLNGHSYVVLGINDEECKEAKFLVERIQKLATHKEVNTESFRSSLLEWEVDTRTLKCQLFALTEMNAIMEAAVQNEGFSGSVIVAQNGKPLLSRSTSEITYRWASITKTITAVAVLQLYENGVIDLDKPITDYFEEYRSAEKYPGFQGITARQLLCHQSLAPNYSDYCDVLLRQYISQITDPIEKEKLTILEKGYQEKLASTIDPNKKRSIEYPPELDALQEQLGYFDGVQSPTEMIENIMALPLKETPHPYHNFAFTLLAQLVEKMTGSYEKYVQENIFDKAGMKTAQIATSEHDHVVAAGYVLDEKGNRKLAQLDNASLRHGSGNINGSVEDLYHFDRALHQEETFLKNKSLIAEMDDQYLGWDNDAPPTVLGHKLRGKTGAFKDGNSTSYQYFPETDTTIIILSNSPWCKRPVAAIGEELAATLFTAIGVAKRDFDLETTVKSVPELIEGNYLDAEKGKRVADELKEVFCTGKYTKFDDRNVFVDELSSHSNQRI